MELGDFLSAVITCSAETGFFCLSLAQANGTGWTDLWYTWPQDRERIVADALAHGQNCNVYFSSYLFSSQRRAKPNVLPTRTIQADLDDADVAALPLNPAVLVSTSPGRYQGFWLLEEEVPLDLHETFSRKLTYAIAKADHSGWPLGRTARMPQTLNHKYLDGPKSVSIYQAPLASHAVEVFDLLPDADKPNAEDDEAWITGPKAEPTMGTHELLNGLVKGKKLGPLVAAKFNVPQADRSAALWGLMLGLFRAGLPRDTVYHIAQASANNKFADMRYHGERELAKDVLRAQAVATQKIPDPRAYVRELRMQGGPAFILRQAIAGVALEVMQAEGQFVHTRDNQFWYIKRDIGRPLAISKASEQLNSLLDIRFGLNPVEPEHHYLRNALINYSVNLPDNNSLVHFSFYNAATNTLMLHTGGRDVLVVTQDSTSTVANGANNVIFAWQAMNDSFRPDLSADPLGGRPWWEIVFGTCFDTVLNMTPDQALALMRVWVHFITLRTAAFNRPILALFGSPGSGKSTIMRRIYRLFYGARKEPLAVTTPENFDLASVSNPFLALDNVDTWASWLPDRLSVSISNISIETRKLWTDADVVTMERQAIIGVTAHNPKFGREDVADRLLLLTFKRIPREVGFAEEKAIYDQIILYRNRIWGALVREQQRILAEPPVRAEEAPPFRVKDFAIVGLRIARALGVTEEFNAALTAIATEQRLFSLEEDSLLVAALKAQVAQDRLRNEVPVERTPGLLWASLEMHSGNPTAFRQMYRNASSLSKKFLALQEPLSELFAVTNHFDVGRGARVWSFWPHEPGCPRQEATS